MFRAVFQWLSAPNNHFDDLAMFEMHLLLCGLLHRDITLAVFDHDADPADDVIAKPDFVRNSIFRLVNRDGLE